MDGMNLAGRGPSRSFTWKGEPGYRPGFLLLGMALFLALWLMPPPGSLVNLVQKETPSGILQGKPGTTLAETVGQALDLPGPAGGSGDPRRALAVANRAKLSLGLLFLAAFFWGTEALPLGATHGLVAAVLYFFGLLPVKDLPRSFVTDEVFFIFGTLALTVGIAKTRLDGRIGLWALSRVKSASGFAFFFLPLVGVAASFLSGHVLVALFIPVLLGVYKISCRQNRVKKDPALAVFLLLGLCLVSNLGGVGTPAAGGRNAVMMSFFSYYGLPMSFRTWAMYGLPMVPILGVAAAGFLYLRCKPRFQVKNASPAEALKAEMDNLPAMGAKEVAMAVIFAFTVIAWFFAGNEPGLGGITLGAVAAMLIFRIVDWQDVQQGVPLDMVGLYASACALGAALKFTGGGLWLATLLMDALPEALTGGRGLVVGISLMAGILTNVMRDGALVSVLGPVILPLAVLAGVHPWEAGMACAFSASFANVFILANPGNAIAFGMAKDPETGERLLEVMDFVKFGLPVTLLALMLFWFCALFGYWTF